MIRKFAQLEFRHGSVERGKTLFEHLVTTCPRRTDIWSVYIDVCVKFGHIDQARFLSARGVHAMGGGSRETKRDASYTVNLRGGANKNPLLLKLHKILSIEFQDEK